MNKRIMIIGMLLISYVMVCMGWWIGVQDESLRVKIIATIISPIVFIGNVYLGYNYGSKKKGEDK